MNKIVFFDNLGRVILGILEGKTDTHIKVINPTILHAQVSNEGKIQVSLVPAFFREYLSDWNKQLVFNYNKDSITIEDNSQTSEILDEKVIHQYDTMWQIRPSREEVRKKVAQEVKPTVVPNDAKPVEKLNLFDTVTPVSS